MVFHSILISFFSMTLKVALWGFYGKTFSNHAQIFFCFHLAWCKLKVLMSEIFMLIGVRKNQLS